MHLQKLEKAQKQILPEPPGGCSPAQTVMFTQ